MKINIKSIIFLVAGIILGYTISYLKIPNPFTKTTNKQQTIEIQNLTMGNATFTSPDKKVSFPYPVVQSGLTSEQTLAFNNFANKSAETFYKLGGTPIEWDGDFKVERADTKIISAVVNSTQYLGGAHPNHYSYVINYSVPDSKEITLLDLFNEKSNYLNTLSPLVRAKLVEEFKKEGLDPSSIESMIEDGTKPDPKNFQKFVIGDFYITFVYDPYEVAPYAFGTRDAMFSFSELSGLLKTDLSKR